MSNTEKTVQDSQPKNPCITCGACCAFFRVSFYWREAEECKIPDHLVEQLTNVWSCMDGTNSSVPRCSALEGEIGKDIRCSIYENRPTPCQEVQPGDEKCHRARAKWGLPPLTTDI